jgi:hypothetical protein
VRELLRRLGSTYARIWRTYWAWAPTLIVLALIVFLPLGLIDVLSAEADVDNFDFGNSVKLAALVAAFCALIATSLIGEVFYSGAVAMFLTHPEDEKPPGLRELAGKIKYGRLILVDLVYVALVALGLVAFFVPGLLAFVWFGLAGPVVEIEKRKVRDALGRSFELVRGSFWLVFFVLAPLEVAGDAFGEAVESAAHSLLGESFLATWLSEAGANTITSPFFAVAVVLLTLDLIARREGTAPKLNPEPAPRADPSPA